MELVFCVMKSQGILFAIYGTREKAESIVERMNEKDNANYYIETRTVL